MEKKNYAYDIAGRLWKVWRNDTLISTYTYDANGNRVDARFISRTDSGTYDAQDRMLQYGNASYVYSKNGELQKKIENTDTTQYTYDYFGNLTTVIMPNGDRIDYIIDGQNRRIGKKINGVIVKKWIYSDQLTPVAELDSAGNVTAQFIGALMIKNGNTYQMIRDHLGSVRLVVDVATGNVAQRLDYDEYGNILSDSNPDFQPFAYAGGMYDTHTQLVRFGARDYDNVTGRWTKKDPIGFGGGVSNLYEYCLNDPVNNIDSDGKQVQWLAKKVLQSAAKKAVKGNNVCSNKEELEWEKQRDIDNYYGPQKLPPNFFDQKPPSVQPPSVAPDATGVPKNAPPPPPPSRLPPH
jgi:RHS repeat-associated protein